jgi:hypothetical protein
VTQPTEEERLETFFYTLQSLIPEPPKNWRGTIKECKYLKILEEKKLSTNGGSYG